MKSHMLFGAVPVKPKAPPTEPLKVEAPVVEAPKVEPPPASSITLPEPQILMRTDWPKIVKCMDGIERIYESHAEWSADAKTRCHR